MAAIARMLEMIMLLKATIARDGIVGGRWLWTEEVLRVCV
jgi:hypothetical protein